MITVYVRLQRCTTKKRQAFVGRRYPYHGIARGPIEYYAVHGQTWGQIRRVLKDAGVIGHTACCADSVCAIVPNPGYMTGYPHMVLVVDSALPPAARFENSSKLETAPVLDKLGRDGQPVGRQGNLNALPD